jgi:mannose/fructose/N-acetylgalactosamine-specific phosphotransferase system component IIC
LALDRTAFLQTMASRPVVAAAIVGAVLGNAEVALRCGLMLELLWLMELPVGASVPPDDTVASVLSVAFAFASPADWSPQARSALGVLVALPFGVLGRWVDVAVRRRNGRLLSLAREGGKGRSLGRLHLLGAVHFTVGAWLLISGAALLGALAIRWTAPQLPAVCEAGFELSASLVPLVGVASVWAALRGRRYAGLVGAGFLAALGGREVAGLAGGAGTPWNR